MRTKTTLDDAQAGKYSKRSGTESVLHSSNQQLAPALIPASTTPSSYAAAKILFQSHSRQRAIMLRVLPHRHK